MRLRLGGRVRGPEKQREGTCSPKGTGLPDEHSGADSDGPLSLPPQEQWKELSHEDLEPPPEHVPPPPRPPKRIPEPHNGKCKEFFPNHQWVKDESEEDKEDGPIKEETRTPLSVPCSLER